MYSDVAHRHQPQYLLYSSVPIHAQDDSDPSYQRRSRLEHTNALRKEWHDQTLPKPFSHSDPVQVSDNSLNSASARGSRTCVAEHMLRRKTPNGTLAAGYDGRPIEWADRRPANKHFLVPTSNAASAASLHPRANCHKARSSHLKHISPALNGERSIENPYNHHGALQVDSKAFNVGISMSEQAESQIHQFPDPGLDSVLYQGSPTHQLSYYPGQQLPMVMQPMWPPCAGITSLNNPGRYGPYWPDGAFVPYRPAPIRDPRFDAGTSSHALNGILQSSETPFGSSFRDPQNPFTFCGATTYSGSPCWSPGAKNIPPDDPKPIQSAFVGPPMAPSPRDSDLKTYGDKPIPVDEQHVHTCRSDRRVPPIPPAADFQVSPYAYCRGAETNNVQFKEKVLIWAHRVYVSLLSLRQQTRRVGPSVQYHNHRYQLENVLPQLPPKTFCRLSNARDPTDTPQEQQQQSSIDSHGYGSELGPQEESIENEKLPFQFATASHDMDATYVDNEHTAPGGSQLNGSYDPLILRITRSKTRSRSVAAPSNHIQPEPSPATSAVTAIEMLSRLCQESGWKWIDGMLLGGCLAYGLGDYNKALKWYSKVLSCDPNNVEANSNLAATFLSNERRQEAEEYWLRTVKLRPSYFEAVEHLVGIYCEDHRGREAVELINFVERSLQGVQACDLPDHNLKPASSKDFTPNIANGRRSNAWGKEPFQKGYSQVNGTLGSSGYSIPSSDNGRLLSLIHGKGNMLYALGDNAGAAKAFEDVILIGSAQRHMGIRSLIGLILDVFSEHATRDRKTAYENNNNTADEPILLMPETALETSKLVFPPYGNLPGLEDVPTSMAKRAGISIVSNSLLSLAKIYQDAMSSSGATATGPRATAGVQEILALYYLSLSLQPSPSTANNVGILLASVQQPAASRLNTQAWGSQSPAIPGVVPGSGVALALAYYNYGLNLDSHHAHLYTNLGSLFKDIGQLSAAIKMYEKAVHCDGSFDIALANLANAVKDQGRISDAIDYYRRAVTANPDFAEAVCGLANALNSVCDWHGRGGVRYLGSSRDRWHVDERGMLYDGVTTPQSGSGWIERVVSIVDKQLRDGEEWGKGILRSVELDYVLRQLHYPYSLLQGSNQVRVSFSRSIQRWANQPWEGAKVVRIVERATKRLGWQLYQNRYIHGWPKHPMDTTRPQLPAALAVPTAPTVLPFHTFTCPLSAKQIRKISQRNGLRISCSTLRSAWLPRQIYEPPPPPEPYLNIGYVSSDFNNHPLAHLMQSVFGFHDTRRVNAICYATTASDGSIHRQQIEREAPIFYDASSWSIDRLVNQIVADGVHILVNLNGYTRGAKNEVFAARPAPVQMSFMGFAGTLGAEWCDYLLADKIAVPPQTLRPYRRNVDLTDQMSDGNNDDDENQWVYGENIIFTRDTFFCCDHRQSAPDARERQLSWEEEQKRRWTMRKELFPTLPDDTVILGNFNQLYKVEPTTFRTWLRVLSRIPKAILWLLRFPDLGETNLRETAMHWVGAEVASRIIFTDVAPKHQHIARARICDLFLDTPECNAHTTAADVLWSGTPLLTFPRYEYKMCSRMAASILTGALPMTPEGDQARSDLIVHSDEDYEERAVELGTDLVYPSHGRAAGMGRGRLTELRKLLYTNRWTSALFDTQRWVRDLEEAYEVAWKRWVTGEGGDIWL